MRVHSNSAHLIWPPAPYAAGFCITDDTDAATLDQVTAVYDYLAMRKFRTTKTVWAFHPEEASGIPGLPGHALQGVTLENPRYMEFCQQLSKEGFEICLHGASAGNNRRARQEAALQLVRDSFGGAGTYVCHSKNAENIYWEENVTRLQPFRTMLGYFSRHQCSGEDPASPYFWGDLCNEHVEQIRLMRTRATNTLSVNPSMPYFDPGKPYVRSWFCATKRALRDCASEQALASLRREHGLTVLYQYLHRYADEDTLRLNTEFVSAIDRICDAEDVLVAPVSLIMRRLRLLQGVFICSSSNSHWALNINTEDACDVQLGINGSSGKTIRLPVLPAGKIIELDLPSDLRMTGRNAVSLNRRRSAVHRWPAGTLAVNCSDSTVNLSTAQTLPSMSWDFHPRTAAPHRPLSCLPRREEFRLLIAQSAIILREMVFLNRRMNTIEYLRHAPTRMELQENW
ncbi:MAG: hypothetical protein IH600_08495 [Bacteroidetes bacterium]|nr:hypothetical protein [Bacteroidota bacterium]